MRMSKEAWDNFQKPKRKKKSRRKGIEDRLDDLWRRVVYKRAGNRCEYCGRGDTLNAHHIFSRSNRAVRWDVDNGACVCVAHHTFGTVSFHKSPLAMTEFINNKRGQEWYNRLMTAAGQPGKMSLGELEEIEARLKQILDA